MDNQGAQRGAPVQAAYAFSVRGPALDAYDRLSPGQQRSLEEALNDLEWMPIPEDALTLEGDRVFAVERAGLWIVYEVDHDRAALDAWALLGS
jgi:hypothetical protein